MTTGFMTRDQAERMIWSWYWQLDNKEDRRVAPLISEPPDHMTAEELKSIRDRQTPLWRKAQLKLVDIVERRSGRLGTFARRISGIFTTEAEKKYALECVLNEEQQKAADQDLTGKVDPHTGLPLSTNDLQAGRGVVSGQDLCMEAIVSPYDLAENFTTWLPPCPPGEDPAKWGDEVAHWESLSYKPKDTVCELCRATGKVTKTVTADVSGGFLIRRNKSDQRSFLATCEECHGAGSRVNWDPDEFDAVRQNARLIGEVVHELAKQGYFDKRPIDQRDVEMGDLVWERKDGMTIGFRLSWEGYKRMKDYTGNDPAMCHAVHVLAYAGSAKDTAPEWAKKELREGRPIQINTGSALNLAPAGGGLKLHTGGNLKL